MQAQKKKSIHGTLRRIRVTFVDEGGFKTLLNDTDELLKLKPYSYVKIVSNDDKQLFIASLFYDEINFANINFWEDKYPGVQKKVEKERKSLKVIQKDNILTTQILKVQKEKMEALADFPTLQRIDAFGIIRDAFETVLEEINGQLLIDSNLKEEWKRKLQDISDFQKQLRDQTLQNARDTQELGNENASEDEKFGEGLNFDEFQGKMSEEEKDTEEISEQDFKNSILHHEITNRQLQKERVARSVLVRVKHETAVTEEESKEDFQKTKEKRPHEPRPALPEEYEYADEKVDDEEEDFDFFTSQVDSRAGAEPKVKAQTTLPWSLLEEEKERKAPQPTLSALKDCMEKYCLRLVDIEKAMNFPKQLILQLTENDFEAFPEAWKELIGEKKNHRLLLKHEEELKASFVYMCHSEGLTQRSKEGWRDNVNISFQVAPNNRNLRISFRSSAQYWYASLLVQYFKLDANVNHFDFCRQLKKRKGFECEVPHTEELMKVVTWIGQELFPQRKSKQNFNVQRKLMNEEMWKMILNDLSIIPETDD